MKAKKNKLLLITPPLLQPNTPYPATPVLTGFLRSKRIQVAQSDLSVRLLRHIFSETGLRQILEICKSRARAGVPDAAGFFIANFDSYLSTVAPVMEFLSGRLPELARRITGRSFLPEGPSFDELDLSEAGMDSEENLERLFGSAGIHDRAKLLASLYLDDIAKIVAEVCDRDFAFSRYAQSLAASASRFDAILDRLNAPPSWIDRVVESMAAELLKRERPDVLGLTIPFPGTLYYALRIAKLCRAEYPETKVVIGGGYVNTELRSLEDERIFNFADKIVFDEGFAPMLRLMTQKPALRTLSAENFTRRDEIIAQRDCDESPLTVEPDYDGLDMSLYFDMTETANPMQRIWSEGKWLKLQLANGCYWGKCAFCDVSLDYISRYRAPDAAQIVETMISMKRKTGLSGFHFTDEAISPALARKLSRAIAASGETFTWWGNIRFEKTFTPELCKEMAESGCIAVTGGLECANDRLLKLMNKGIDLKGAKSVLRAFADAGILVHAYLMYGFPTQTAAETMKALQYVRDRFREGSLHSAFWHRFALTAHSPISRAPERFGITLNPSPAPGKRFAENEIFFQSRTRIDWRRIGAILERATYNYMLGLGLDEPVSIWERTLPSDE